MSTTLAERAVTYRDDREGLRAQNAALEAELSEAREEIERLRTGKPRASRASSNAWLGGPSHVQIERKLDVDVDETLLEDLVNELRSRFGDAGRIERLGRTVSWTSHSDPRSGRNVTVHFTRRNGGTRVRIEESLRRVAGGLFGGVVGGAGGAGAANLAVWSVITANVLLALGAVGWLSLVYFIVRAAYANWSQKRVDDLERLAGDIEDRVNEASVRKRRKKARVAEEEREPLEEDDSNTVEEARRRA